MSSLKECVECVILILKLKTSSLATNLALRHVIKQHLELYLEAQNILYWLVEHLLHF